MQVELKERCKTIRDAVQKQMASGNPNSWVEPKAFLARSDEEKIPNRATLFDVHQRFIRRADIYESSIFDETEVWSGLYTLLVSQKKNWQP